MEYYPRKSFHRRKLPSRAKGGSLKGPGEIPKECQCQTCGEVPICGYFCPNSPWEHWRVSCNNERLICNSCNNRMERLTDHPLYQDKFMSLMREYKVKCINGCQEWIPYADYIKHTNHCKCRQIKCNNCNKLFFEEEFREHLESGECSMSGSTRYSKCKELVKLNELHKHLCYWRDEVNKEDIGQIQLFKEIKIEGGEDLGGDPHNGEEERVEGVANMEIGQEVKIEEEKRSNERDIENTEDNMEDIVIDLNGTDMNNDNNNNNDNDDVKYRLLRSYDLYTELNRIEKTEFPGQYLNAMKSLKRRSKEKKKEKEALWERKRNQPEPYQIPTNNHHNTLIKTNTKYLLAQIIFQQSPKESIILIIDCLQENIIIAPHNQIIRNKEKTASMIRPKYKNICACTAKGRITIWASEYFLIESDTHLVLKDTSDIAATRLLLIEKGTILLSFMTNGEIWVWDLKTMRKKFAIEGNVEIESVCKIVRRSRRRGSKHKYKKIVTGDKEGRIKVWRITGEEERLCKCIKEIPGAHSGAINVIIGLKRRKYQIVSGGADKRVRIWEIKEGRCLRTISVFTSGISGLITINKEQRIMSICRSKNSLRVWDISSGQLLTTYQGISGLMGAKFSGNKYIAVGGHKFVNIWDRQQKRWIAEIVNYLPTVIMPFAHDYLLVATRNGKIKVLGQYGAIFEDSLTHGDYVTHMIPLPCTLPQLKH